MQKKDVWECESQRLCSNFQRIWAKGERGGTERRTRIFSFVPGGRRGVHRQHFPARTETEGSESEVGLSLADQTEKTVGGSNR